VIKLPEHDPIELHGSAQEEADHYRWVRVHDGYELWIQNVDNLAIVGSGASSGLVVKPQYAYVLSFENATGIRLEASYFGHTEEKGRCTGGVLRLKNSERILIRDCDLYGSGFEGLYLDEVDGMEVRNSIIRECTYGIMRIFRSKNLSFDQVVFRDNGPHYGIEVGQRSTVHFERCSFSNNSGEDALIQIEDSSGVVVRASSFSRNTFKEQSNVPGVIVP